MDEALGGETFDPQECKGAGEGRQARKGRCRGLLEFEADDVSGKQVRWGLLHSTQWHFGTETPVALVLILDALPCFVTRTSGLR